MAESADLRAQLRALLATLDEPAPAAAPDAPTVAAPAPAPTGDAPHRLGQLVVRDGRYGLVIGAGHEGVDGQVRPYCAVVWLVGPHERVQPGHLEAVS
jgi:hypothetical protein